jgi:hypothetical protein
VRNTLAQVDERCQPKGGDGRFFASRNLPGLSAATADRFLNYALKPFIINRLPMDIEAEMGLR